VPRPLVAIRLPPEDFGAALRRAWAAGEAVLPLPLDAPAGVLEGLVDTLRPARIVADAADLDAGIDTGGDQPAHVDDDVALVVATSGSTGRPKGVVLTHAALDASTRASMDRLRCQPGERWLLALPLHHVAGIQVMLRAWRLGTEPVVVDPAATESIATADAEHVSLVPTQLARLVEAGADLGRFRTILLGGARADRALLRQAARTGGRVVISYGMTETCGGCVYDGVALDGIEVRVRDDGRIEVRGPVLFAGYLGGPEPASGTPVDDDGWFTTGDFGRIAGGRLEVLGRSDDVIIRGGENVPLDAVAAALRTHPAIADAAAVTRPDRDWGEIVVAVVVPMDTASPPDLAELRTHVLATHPRAYAPHALVLTDALPRDQLGKLRRTGLDALANGPERG